MSTQDNISEEAKPVEFVSRLNESVKKFLISNELTKKDTMSHSTDDTNCNKDMDEKMCLLSEKHDVKPGGKDPEPEESNFMRLLTVIIMCTVNFFCFTNFSILSPIFPPSAEQKGMSTTVVGLVIGVYNLIMFITSPLIGAVISRVGAKFMFVSGSLFSASCGILFGFLEYGPDGILYIVFCFLTRGLQALGCAAFETSSYAIIAKKYPERVTTYFSLLETFAGIGMMTGPPIGGVLYQVGGYYLPFAVTGVALALSGIIAQFSLKIVKDKYEPNDISIVKFVFKPVTMLLVLTVVINSVLMTFPEPTLAAFLQRFNLEPYQIGFVFLIIPGIYAVISPILGYICDKKGYLTTVMIVGSLICGVGYTFIGPAPIYGIEPQLWVTIIGISLVGLSLSSTFVPAFPALIITAYEYGYPDNFDTCGMVSGVILSAFAFGGFAGATSSGILVDLIGFQWSTLIVGCLMVSVCVYMGIFAIVQRTKVKGDIFDRQRTVEKMSLEKGFEV